MTRTIRRLLRRLLLWLATALDDAGTAAGPVHSGGPPADWLARVRRGAPQLLEDEPDRPAIAQDTRSGERSQPVRRPANVATFPPAARQRPAPGRQPAPRGTRVRIEEELVARKAPTTSEGQGGPPRFRPLVEHPAAAPVQPVHQEEAVAPARRQEIATPRVANGNRTGHAGKESNGTEHVRKPVTAEAVRPALPVKLEPPPVTASRSGRRDEPRELEPEWPAHRWPELPPQAPDSPPRPGDVATNELPAERLRSQTGGDARPSRGTAYGDEPLTMPDLPWPRLEETSALHERRTHYEELSRQERFTRAVETAPSPEPDRRWPELPPLPPFAHESLAPVESLDDPDRRRRIDEEQRRSGWSE